MLRYIYYIIFLMLLSYSSIAQLPLDSILLPEIILEESRLNNYKSAINTNIINNDIIGKTNTQSFSDFLIFNTSYYVKRYGALSTPTFRGTTSSQTLVLWNDIPINSIANGLADLSILPIHSFNQTTIIPGGNASIFGGGSIGGSIHINSKLNFNNSKEINIGFESGSYGLQSKSLFIMQSDNKFAFSVYLQSLSDINNFKFINTSKLNSPIEINNYGSIFTKQEQFNFLFKLSKKNIITLSYWGTDNDREVPQNMTTPFSDAKQYDNSNKGLISISHKINDIYMKAKYAYLMENFKYTETSKNINSFYTAETSIYEINFKKELNNNIINLCGIITQNNVANNNYLNNNIRDDIISVISSYKYKNKISKINLIFRKEWHSKYEVPITPTLSFNTLINKNFDFNAKYSKNFRAPTFNDRYWIGAGSVGNINLQPENSNNFEIGSNFIYNNLMISATIYSLSITNMIIWTPNVSGQWQPINTKKVWSRGFESRLVLKFNNINIETNYNLTKSTNESKSNDNDYSFNKQLTYVPLNKGNVSLIYKFNNSKIILSHVMTDKVVTSYSSNGEKYLDGFFLTDITYDTKLNNLPFYLNFKIKNIFDISYQTYENYPNPGREYLLTINYLFN